MSTSPRRKKTLRRLARRKALQYGVPPELLVAQLNQESRFEEGLVSPAGAREVAQFMPGTAKTYGVNLYDNRSTDDIDGAARMMRDLLKRYGGDERKALAAYNAGAGAVEKYGGVPPYAETQAYVKKILAAAGASGRAPSRGPSLGSSPSYSSTTDTVNVPGIDNASARQQARLEYLQAPSHENFMSLALSLRGLQDRAGSTVSLTTSGATTSKRPGGRPGGRAVLAAGADRAGVQTNRSVVRFVRRISARVGRPLTIGTGTNHNEYTVNGNVSDHWGGNAADIPATGRRLIRLGQAALIEAGMNPRKARKQTGGLFNVNGAQIIFNTHIGGDHTNHLHVRPPK